MVKRRVALLASLVAVVLMALPGGRQLLASAPENLSVLINGYTVRGKALWYKGKIYVPLEDVANATGGTYSYDPSSGVANVTVGNPPPPPRREVVRPYIKVRWERKYLTGNNAKVVATIANTGEVPAENLEAICIFKDGYLREINAVTRDVGQLLPGQSVTLEFQLYDGYSPYYGAVNTSVDPLLYDKILVDGQWTRVSYALKFNYQ